VIDLTKYYSAKELDLAWVISPDMEYIRDEDGGPSIFTKGNIAPKIATCDFMSQLDRKIVLSSMKMLGELMHQGPVVIRPGLALAEALLDTELNFSSSDYHQPFKVMAVEIPDEILGIHAPGLALVYQVFPCHVITCIRGYNNVTFHAHVGDDLPTIEDRITQLEWADTEEEAKLVLKVWRIAINACLLAATRQTKTTVLPENVAKKRRRKQDPRVQQLAARHCQEILFRDLIIYDRVKTGTGGKETGVTYGPQNRRGHWKKIPFGPKHSLRRLQWINDYWTHREIKFGDEKPTIIMK
jgi:hypothetical protein